MAGQQPPFPNLRPAPAQPAPDIWADDGPVSDLRFLWGLIITVLYSQCSGGAVHCGRHLNSHTFYIDIPVPDARGPLEEILRIVETRRQPDAATVQGQPCFGAFNPTQWRWPIGTRGTQRWGYVLLHLW